MVGQKAAPHMKADGRIVFVSSGVTPATTVIPSYLVYSACKGAIEQMTRVMAKDLGRRGILVNAIAPGPTASELFYNGKTKEMIDGFKRLSPLNDLGKPEDPANLAAFLAGDESRWISGQVIRVNGANQV